MKKTIIRNGKRYAFAKMEDGILTVTVSALNWVLCDPVSAGYGRPEKRIRLGTNCDGVNEVRVIDNVDYAIKARQFEIIKHSGVFFAKVRA